MRNKKFLNLVFTLMTSCFALASCNEVGEQGPIGDIGDRGPQGEAGTQGPKGDPGTQGPKGEKGNSGADGNNGIVIRNYQTYVRKHMDFDGKSSSWVGDSICWGHPDNRGNSFGEKFCNKTNMQCHNFSVSGAVYTPHEGDGLVTIQQEIESNLSTIVEDDFLFIEGGVNDWVRDRPMNEFKNSLNSLVAYLNVNIPQTTSIIVITPFNVGNLGSNNDERLYFIQEYRNAITEEFLGNDLYSRFSIVQGSDAPFPSGKNSLEYQNVVTVDGCHPTNVGYTLIADTLFNVLF